MVVVGIYLLLRTAAVVESSEPRHFCLGLGQLVLQQVGGHQRALRLLAHRTSLDRRARGDLHVRGKRLLVRLARRAGLRVAVARRPREHGWEP